MEDMVIVPHFFTCSLHCSDFGPLFENELIQLGNFRHGVNYSDFLLFFMIWLHYLWPTPYLSVAQRYQPPKLFTKDIF